MADILVKNLGGEYQELDLCREIDLIAKKDGQIHFVEVKYRTTSDFGSPLEAVDFRKQNQIRKVAMYYLMKNKLTEWTPCQFDVIAFEGEKMTHLENAF